MRFNSFYFIFLILCLIFFPAAGDAGTQIDLKEYLPEKTGGSWQKKDSPQEYIGEDLFLYINGGAEIYHEYGFQKVIVQEYSGPEDSTIILELYQMADPESAYGIYTFKTTPQGRELGIGMQALLEDYYLNFWKGPFLATLTGFDESDHTIQGLKSIAGAVDSLLEAQSQLPSLIKLLPQNGLIASGIDYFEGRLGLSNSRRFFSDNLFRIQKGVRGNYTNESSVFIFQYKDRQESRNIYNDVKTGFMNSPEYSYTSVRRNPIQVKDSRGNLIYAESVDRYIVIAAGDLTPEEAQNIFSRIGKSIEDR